MRVRVFVWAIWLVLSTSLQASGIRLPTGFGKRVQKIIAKDRLDEFVLLLRNFPHLVHKGAALDKQGNTVMHVLAQRGRVDMIACAHVFYLIKYSDIDMHRPKGLLINDFHNHDGMSPADVAEQNKNAAAASLLRIIHGSGTSESVKKAIRKNDVGSFETILQAITLVNTTSEHRASGIILRGTLKEAILRGSDRMFNLLVSAGAELNNQLISYAVEADNVRIIEYLISNGNSDPYALHKAAADGKVDATYALLDSGVEIDTRDTKGYTALDAILAKQKEDIRETHKMVATILIDRGASMNNKKMLVEKLGIHIHIED